MSAILNRDDLADRAARFLALGCVPLVGIGVLTAAAVGNPVVPILIGALLFTALAGIGASSGGFKGQIAVAVGFVGQAAVITAAFAGHPLQMDAHMIFFALLAMTMAMGNVAAILMATTAIALHHLSLVYLMPALVYPADAAQTNLSRVVFHAVVVAVEAGALWAALAARARLDAVVTDRSRVLAKALEDGAQESARADKMREAAEDLRDKADTARQEAEEARARAEAGEAVSREARAEMKRADTEFRRAAAAVAADQTAVVRTLSDALARLARQDLSVRIDGALGGEYESLEQDFDQAITSVETAIASVTDLSDKIVGLSDVIRDSARDLSDRTSRQTDTLAQTTELVGDISSRLAIVAEGTVRVDGLVHDVSDAASNAGDVVQKAEASVKEMKDITDRIGAIVELIDDIAFQTNLLALNAGIEAARAGDAGRGFAVVAAEVGALARRSADSASEIGALTDRCGTSVDTSVSFVNDTARALDRVTDIVSKARATISEISDAAGEQSIRLRGVDGAMEALDNDSRSNADTAHGSAGHAEELADLSDRLRAAMDPFSRPVPNAERAA